MFEQKFNPEFHWQINRKLVTYKKIIFSIIIIFLALFSFFIFRRYYLVADRSISLSQLVPDDVRVTLSISTFDIVKNKRNLFLFDKSWQSELGLKEYLDTNQQSNVLVDNIGSEIYWLERGSESQTLLLKIRDVIRLKAKLKTLLGNAEQIKFDNKTIYGLGVEPSNNYFLPISENTEAKIYIVYLNNYVFVASNNLDFTKDIIRKYREFQKMSYLTAIKNKITYSFKEQKALILKVNNYNELENSLSWIKKLSFITAGNKKSFVLKLGVGLGKMELLFNDSQNLRQRVGRHRPSLDNKLFDNLVLYYSNVNAKTDSEINFNDNISHFLQNNIEGLYNFNFKEELLNTNFTYNFLLYPQKKFLLITKDADRLKRVYRNLLAHLKPSTRIMILPDGNKVTEYYSDSSLIKLKAKANENLIWYYADLKGKVNFYLVQDQDRYILSNSKEKVIELAKSKDKLCKLLNCNEKVSFKEKLMLNLQNIDGKKYFPWLNLFSKTYSKINFVSWSENEQNNLFFELIH